MYLFEEIKATYSTVVSRQVDKHEIMIPNEIQ